ncbi:endonuclease III domain-containing protein [Thermovibrio ammonificans]
MKELIEKAKEIHKRLKELFPEPHRPNRTPLEQAVFTVLSQNTTDLNASRCLERLKRATGGKLLEIPQLTTDELVEAIRPCGMFKQKERALRELVSRWPRLEEKLRELPPEEGIKLLTELSYIGPKTARVILTFGFGKNTFPIDTHCKKVLSRLGIFPKGWSTEEISRFFEKHFSARFNRELHYNLIRLGRRVCKARKPECERCPLRNLCSYRRR